MIIDSTCSGLFCLELSSRAYFSYKNCSIDYTVPLIMLSYVYINFGKGTFYVERFNEFRIIVIITWENQYF